MSKLIQLHPDDNLLVVRSTLHEGDTERINEILVTFAQTIPIGHKVAARHIQNGERIIKYGVPIGSATKSVAIGEHLHLHNVKSDYLPTYTIDES